MNYIVFDLEFNQGYKYKRKNKSRINPKCRFEIIQIGAVKLNDKLETIDRFDKLVKPQIYKCLHNFISEMTDITIEKLSAASLFNQVYDEWIEFIGEDAIMCTWGVADMRELVRNINYHNLDLSVLPRDYIDLQRIASSHFKTPNGNSIGLKNAVECLKLPLTSQFHDAFNDAYYTAEVFKKIYTDDIVPITYNVNEGDNQSEAKKIKIDTVKLMNQFEKMFKRELSEEEHKIVKLAFNMGRTGQFQSDEDEELK